MTQLTSEAASPYLLIGAASVLTVAILGMRSTSPLRQRLCTVVGVLACCLTFATVGAVRRSETVAQVEILVALMVVGVELGLIAVLDRGRRNVGAPREGSRAGPRDEATEREA